MLIQKTHYPKKTELLLLILSCTFITRAQPTLQNISGVQKMEKQDTVIKKRILTDVADPVSEISRKISLMMDTYLAYPNNKDTWTIITNKAFDILLHYHKTGFLKGKIAIEAFFVKMGPETMTSGDLLNHKMILVAGIATQKPAEFAILRFEKTGTGAQK